MNQSTNVHTLPGAQPAPTLDDLAAEHLLARETLAAAQEQLNRINERIIAAVGVKDEGSFSVEGDFHKVTTTQPLTRTVDPKLAQDIYRALPKDLADGIFTWKPSLNLKLYRELAKYQPDYHAAISKAIVTKPGKPQVKVAVLDPREAA
jgi:hypothetical protein